MRFTYLDNNATTRPDPAVVRGMTHCLTDVWANPVVGPPLRASSPARGWTPPGSNSARS
jgi:hypothetical protein